MQTTEKIPTPPHVGEICTPAEIKSIASSWQSIQVNLFQVSLVLCESTTASPRGDRMLRVENVLSLLTRCRCCTQAFVLSELRGHLVAPTARAAESMTQLNPTGDDAVGELASKLRVVRSILLCSKSKRCATIAMHTDNPDYW